MPYHDTRETLAYTKWYLDKLKLKLGIKKESMTCKR